MCNGDNTNGLVDGVINTPYWTGHVSRGVVTLTNNRSYEKVLIPIKHKIVLKSGDIVTLTTEVIRRGGLAYHGIGICDQSEQAGGITFGYPFYYNAGAQRLQQTNSVVIDNNFVLSSIGLFTRTSTVDGLQFVPHISVNGNIII